MNGGLRGSMRSQIQRTTMFLKQLRLKLRYSVPWICTRDFNEITQAHENWEEGYDQLDKYKISRMYWVNVDFKIWERGESLLCAMDNDKDK